MIGRMLASGPDEPDDALRVETQLLTEDKPRYRLNKAASAPSIDACWN
jgi:hypothetical protein